MDYKEVKQTFARLNFKQQIMALEIAEETVTFLKKREWAIRQFMNSGMDIDQATKEVEEVLNIISATVNIVKGEKK